MKTLAYTVDIEKLFNAQDSEVTKIDHAKKEFDAIGARNKEQLLRIALPFIHGVYALHNRKCTHTTDSSTGNRGLLGLSQVNIEKEIDYIVNTDSNYVWSNNFTTITVEVMNGKKIKIWLNSRNGCHKSTPHLDYSMTSVNSIYGTSIEDELVTIAKYCSRYKDEWGCQFERRNK